MNQALFNYGSAAMNAFPDKTMVTVDDEMLKYHKDNTNNVLTPYMGLCSAFFHILDVKGEYPVKNSPYYTQGNLDLYKKIKSIAIKHNTGITQVLLGFILTRSPEMLPLISADIMEHLELAMDTLSINFSPEEF